MITHSHSFQLDVYIKQKQAVINKKLDELLKERALPGRLYDAMRYAVSVGGKRLRPILCMAAEEAVRGTATEASLVAGCAIECIHTYSLVHDDLPAMDDDVLRRGNPTCHVAFDEATAILAGDALLTVAFEILSDFPESATASMGDVFETIRIISNAAGGRGMVEGQMRDMLAEGKLISQQDLEALHRLKTGALITASVESGAVLGGADESARRQLKLYAEKLGTAFQVTDDLLNVEGDPVKMGKAVGTDLNKQKSTYPSLIGIEGSRKKAGELIDGALKALDSFDTKANPLRAIAVYVLEREA